MKTVWDIGIINVGWIYDFVRGGDICTVIDLLNRKHSPSEAYKHYLMHMIHD